MRDEIPYISDAINMRIFPSALGSNNLAFLRSYRFFDRSAINLLTFILYVVVCVLKIALKFLQEDNKNEKVYFGNCGGGYTAVKCIRTMCGRRCRQFAAGNGKKLSGGFCKPILLQYVYRQ